MNQQLRQQLEKTIQIAQSLLDGEEFYVYGVEFKCVPVPVMTKTAAAKKGLVLKRGAKRVGIWGVRVAAGAADVQGDLYLETSFKRKEAQS